MLPARTTSCPTDLDLEQHLEVPDLRVQAHAASCRHCAGWLTAALSVGERFEREVAPYQLHRVLGALEAESAKPRGLAAVLARLRFPFASGVVAAALSVALVLVLQKPDPGPAFIVKGAGLQVHVRHGSEVRTASSGDEVAPGDALRFTVSPSGPRFVWILSIDSRGHVSRLSPPGDEPGFLDGPTTLPGSAVLDAVPGPERIFAVMSREPIPWAEVQEAAAHAAASGGARSVRGLDLLPLPGTEQATLLLERGR